MIVKVSYTTQRPIIPDEKFHYVLVNPEDGMLLAAQIVQSHCTMVTRTEVVR